MRAHGHVHVLTIAIGTRSCVHINARATAQRGGCAPAAVVVGRGLRMYGDITAAADDDPIRIVADQLRRRYANLTGGAGAVMRSWNWMAATQHLLVAEERVDSAAGSVPLSKIIDKQQLAFCRMGARTATNDEWRDCVKTALARRDTRALRDWLMAPRAARPWHSASLQQTSVAPPCHRRCRRHRTSTRRPLPSG